MKVASVVWRKEYTDEISNPERLIDKIKTWLHYCQKNEVRLIVFPALLGNFFDTVNKYLKQFLELSLRYKQIAICPGTIWEKDGSGVFHTSYLLEQGQILLKQRQMYLARWERAQGLARGIELATAELEGFKIGILVSTDVFYPHCNRLMVSTLDIGQVAYPICMDANYFESRYFCTNRK